MLSGRSLCDALITRSEDSYRLWCVVACDLETSRMRRPWPALDAAPQEKKMALDAVGGKQRDQKLNMTHRQADKKQGKVKMTDRQTDRHGES